LQNFIDGKDEQALAEVKKTLKNAGAKGLVFHS